MRVGMLWFDDNKDRTLAEKIDRAARHYQDKYGVRPTLVYVHPVMMQGSKIEVPGIEVKTTNMVLPHHLWLGRTEEDRHAKL